MAMPEGWERKTRGTHTVEWSLPRLVLVQFSPLVPSMPSVRILGLGDDSMDVEIFDRKTFDNFIGILRRAWRQVEHFKAHPGGPPLTEEEEGAPVEQTWWWRCTGCQEVFPVMDGLHFHNCKHENARLERADPPAGEHGKRAGCI